MKRLLIVAIYVLVLAALCACGSKERTCSDILKLPDENPVSIEVLYDDPSVRSAITSDEDAIEYIMSALLARTYTRVKTVSPGSNTRLKLKYSNGTEKTVGLHGITDGLGRKYEPAESDDLEADLSTESKINTETSYDISMRVKEGTLTPSGAVVIVENRINDETVGIIGGVADDYHLEYSSNGKWYRVNYLSGGHAVVSLGVWYSRGQHEMTIDWSMVYGELPPGQYRIMKDYRASAQGGTSEEFWLAAEFSIGQD